MGNAFCSWPMGHGEPTAVIQCGQRLPTAVIQFGPRSPTAVVRWALDVLAGREDQITSTADTDLAYALTLVGGNAPFVELTKLHADCRGRRTSVVVGVEALPGGPTGAVSQFSPRTKRRVPQVVNDKKPHRSSKKVRCGCMGSTDLSPDRCHAPDWWSLRAIT